MTIDLGSGAALDKNFDFSVDETGDIEASYGFDELEKDLAFKMAINLQQFLGQTPTGGTIAKVSNIARRVAQNDPRINAVPTDQLSVSFSDELQEITIELVAQIGGVNERFIFTV
jgi:hypothetical protein